MRIRTVETLPVRIQTSIGEIGGELCSDREIGIGLVGPDGKPVADRDAYVESPSDLASLIASLGVPPVEAKHVADSFWDAEVAPMWDRWTAREAALEAKRDHPSIWKRLTNRFGNPS